MYPGRTYDATCVMTRFGKLGSYTARSWLAPTSAYSPQITGASRLRCACAFKQPPEWLSRSHLIMGSEALQKLQTASVTVVGLGGVGSWCAEMLVRSGVHSRSACGVTCVDFFRVEEQVSTTPLQRHIRSVMAKYKQFVGLGNLVLVDGDMVDSSNRNRQLPALCSTVGKRKVDVMQTRLLDINPDVNLTLHHVFLEPKAARQLAQQPCSYIIDCIDSVAPKVELIHAATEYDQPIISSMGAGGKTDPASVTVADICDTHHDAFARVVRTRLRKRGVFSRLPVVFSPEPVIPNSLAHTEQRYKRSYYGTMSYMPAVFGMHAAAAVIRELSRADERVAGSGTACVDKQSMEISPSQKYMYHI